MIGWLGSWVCVCVCTKKEGVIIYIYMEREIEIGGEKKLNISLNMGFI